MTYGVYYDGILITTIENVNEIQLNDDHVVFYNQSNELIALVNKSRIEVIQRVENNPPHLQRLEARWGYRGEGNFFQ
jgi:hypothetical protein